MTNAAREPDDVITPILDGSHSILSPDRSGPCVPLPFEHALTNHLLFCRADNARNYAAEEQGVYLAATQFRTYDWHIRTTAGALWQLLESYDDTPLNRELMRISIEHLLGQARGALNPLWRLVHSMGDVTFIHRPTKKKSGLGGFIDEQDEAKLGGYCKPDYETVRAFLDWRPLLGLIRRWRDNYEHHGHDALIFCCKGEPAWRPQFTKQFQHLPDWVYGDNALIMVDRLLFLVCGGYLAFLQSLAKAACVRVPGAQRPVGSFFHGSFSEAFFVLLQRYPDHRGAQDFQPRSSFAVKPFEQEEE